MQRWGKDGSGKETGHTLEFLITETQKSGVIPVVDGVRWKDTDRHGSVSVATDGQMRGIDFKGMLLQSGPVTTRSFVGPGYATTHAAADLLDDVLAHRHGVAAHSHMGDSFRAAAREFRAYLAASITAVEAHVMREAYVAGIAKKIPKMANLEQKINYFTEKMSHGRTMAKGQPWSELEHLRCERNKYVHQREPTHNFELEQVAEHLNRCRLGVGQLLIDIYEHIKRHPHPNIIAVRYAPQAAFALKRDFAPAIMTNQA